MNAKISGGLIQATMFGGALLACSALHAATSNWSPPRTADGKPVISGVWSNASVTNLTRPAGVTKLVVTREEAEALVKANPFQRLIEADNGPSDLNDNLLEDKNADRGYNAFWVDPGNFLASVNGEYRTSWIVEPANGQMPLSDAGRKLIQAGRAERDLNLYAGPEALPLPERCLIAFSGASGPGMLNPMYNNNYQIVQTPDAVLINVEMVHDARIVPVDGSPHLPSGIRQYKGDSRGRWDGETLVIETTNFIDRMGVGMNGTGASDALTITERFRRTSHTSLSYSITLDDPKTWTAPFTLEYPLARDDRYGMFEYACHEGNYALQNILRGTRP